MEGRGSAPGARLGRRTPGVLRGAVRRRRRPLLLATAASFCYLATLLALPLVAGTAVDRIASSSGPVDLTPQVIALGVLAIVRAGAGAARKYQAAKLMASVGSDLRTELAERMTRVSFLQQERIGIGEVMARASSDVNAIETALAMLPFAVQSVMLAVGGTVILLVLDPLLALCLLGAVAATAAIALRLVRPIERSAVAQLEAASAFTSFAEQRIAGMHVVKGHGLEAAHRAAGGALVDRMRDAGAEVMTARASFLTAASLIPAASMLVVVGLGAALALGGHATPGDLLTFLQYLWTLVAPVMIAAQGLSLFPHAITGARRIEQVLAAEPEITEPVRPVSLPHGPGSIRFDRVSFDYGGRAAVRDLSLEIPGGTAVAIVGPSGSGKSTVARLMLRLVDPDAGWIALDGVPIDRVPLATLRREVAMVFQEPAIVTATVRENIALGFPNADEARIRKAAELARADEFIRALPDGYETVLHAGAIDLSGGQMQRLSLARALLRDPRVLILDDATSALDEPTAEAIRDALRTVVRGRTTIIIAHHAETVALADVAFALDDGRLVAAGSPGEILATVTST